MGLWVPTNLQPKSSYHVENIVTPIYHFSVSESISTVCCWLVLVWDVNAVVYPFSYSVASVYQHGSSVHICIISVSFKQQNIGNFQSVAMRPGKGKSYSVEVRMERSFFLDCEFTLAHCSWISTMILRVRCRPPWTTKIGGEIWRVFST